LSLVPLYNERMAEPARQSPAVEESPPIDSGSVHRAYHLYRARRRARLEHRRNVSRARLRFWVFLLALIALTVFLAVTVWHEIQRLFGL